MTSYKRRNLLDDTTTWDEIINALAEEREDSPERLNDAEFEKIRRYENDKLEY